MITEYLLEHRLYGQCHRSRAVNDPCPAAVKIGLGSTLKPEHIDRDYAMAHRVRRLRSLSLLAEACLETVRIEEGLSAAREGLAETEETKVRFYEAELNRLEGELLLAAGEPDQEQAEASFRKAIAIARRQSAQS